MQGKVNTAPLHGLAQMLVLEGLLTETQAPELVLKAKKGQTPLAQYLVEEKVLPARKIATAAAKVFGVPFLDLDAYDKELAPIDLVSEKLIHRHHALPIFQRGSVLFVAVSDPSQQIILDEIKFHTGLNTHCVVVDGDKLSKLIEKALSQKESQSLGSFLEEGDLDNLEISSDDDADNENGEHEDGDDAPIVRFVHKVIIDAVNSGASDIHFEPYEKIYRVRTRMDGILYEVAAPPLNLAGRISSRIKIMSRLDISERRIPQDGRFVMKVSRNRNIDFRVSTCPTVNGEKVVMRILDPASATIGIEGLGFAKSQQESFLKSIHQPQGMILVTGPTGSGKTVTLYTALNILNTEEKNISTAEDPVEIKLSGVNQVNINTKTGLTFSSALRSFLRQDPDIIMVGEMRDLETAEIGIKAAQTGHLVLSTLHTNSAPETLTRLVNMGVAPFNIASSVSLIIAQRLARRLCEKCKEPAEVPEATLIGEGFSEDDIKELTIYKAKGCDNCTQGYRGRVGLYEVLIMTKEIGDIIMSDGNATDILNEAKNNGMVTLRGAGLNQIKAGVTSLEEINRVTKD
jgi:type IV pilus assembly protein PilB